MIKAVIFDFFGVMCQQSGWMGPSRLNLELIEYIKQLKTHFKIGILSNSNEAWLREILADNEIDSLFDEIVASSTAGVPKPSYEIFHLILDKLKLRPEEAVFVDDNPGHIRAAQNLGMKAVLYNDVYELQQMIRAHMKGSDA